MRIVGLAGVLALALAASGCSRPSETVSGQAAYRSVAATEAAPASDATAPEAAEAPAGGGGEGAAGTPATPPGAPMLAYVYGASLELPAKTVRETMAKHEAACRAAGLAICQVLGSSVNTSDDEHFVSGNLQLRAEPRWLERFRNTLDSDARGVGGRVRETTVQSEDLTRAIVDTDARLRAQKTLRDRLEALLRSRPGKLSDLLETERELARVQGDIDSAESELAVMRQRVATSLLNLGYQSKPNAVTGGTFEPVISAITDFAGIVMQGIGAIIRLVAFLVPVGLILVPLGWAFLRWRRARLARKAAQAAPKAQD